MANCTRVKVPQFSDEDFKTPLSCPNLQARAGRLEEKPNLFGNLLGDSGNTSTCFPVHQTVPPADSPPRQLRRPWRTCAPPQQPRQPSTSPFTSSMNLSASSSPFLSPLTLLLATSTLFSATSTFVTYLTFLTYLASLTYLTRSHLVDVLLDHNSLLDNLGEAHGREGD